MMRHAPFLGQVPLRGTAWKPAPMRPNPATATPVQSKPSPTLGQNERPSMVVPLAIAAGLAAITVVLVLTLDWLEDK